MGKTDIGQNDRTHKICREIRRGSHVGHVLPTLFPTSTRLLSLAISLNPLQ